MKLDLLRHDQALGRSIGGVLERSEFIFGSLRHHESGSRQPHESGVEKQEYDS